MPKESVKRKIKSEKVEKTEEVKGSAARGQVIKGRVVSAKLAKTATVLVEMEKIHPLYRKTFRRSKRYLVDDQLGVKEGDLVQMVKVRPISKNKHWSIVKIVGKDIEAMVVEKLKEEAASEIAEAMPTEEKETEVALEKVEVEKVKAVKKKANKKEAK